MFTSFSQLQKILLQQDLREQELKVQQQVANLNQVQEQHENELQEHQSFLENIKQQEIRNKLLLQAIEPEPSATVAETDHVTPGNRKRNCSQNSAPKKKQKLSPEEIKERDRINHLRNNMSKERIMKLRADDLRRNARLVRLSTGEETTYGKMKEMKAKAKKNFGMTLQIKYEFVTNDNINHSNFSNSPQSMPLSTNSTSMIQTVLTSESSQSQSFPNFPDETSVCSPICLPDFLKEETSEQEKNTLQALPPLFDGLVDNVSSASNNKNQFKQP